MDLDHTGYDGLTRRVVAARSGDQDAYGEVVTHLWSELVGVARGVLSSDVDAEDLVQEALVHGWRRLWMLRDPERFPAWMRRIVVRRCLTRVRRRRQMSELEDVACLGGGDDARRDVVRLLAVLPVRQRAAVYLTWVMGYTDCEVGAMLGIAAATVRVHRHRGLRHLKNMVKE